jgi:hypothetical protein
MPNILKELPTLENDRMDQAEEQDAQSRIEIDDPRYAIP